MGLCVPIVLIVDHHGHHEPFTAQIFFYQSYQSYQSLPGVARILWLLQMVFLLCFELFCACSLRNFLQIVLLCDQGCQDQFLKPIYLLTPISRMPARARAAKVARAALTVRRMIEPPGTTVHPCHYDLVCPGSCPVNCIVQFLYVVVLEC